MSAQSIQIDTIVFPDPDRTETINDDFVTLLFNESFQYPVPNIQTLSSKGVERGDDPYGLLYLPSLQTDECRRSEEQYIPANTTRLANLPYDAGYALIAVAPWFSPTCIQEYFATARNEPVKAFVVYLPDPNSEETPPGTNDQAWALNDGGNWQYKNDFPTYAIPGSVGNLIVNKMSNYSGNISTVPYGDTLELQYEETDYVRLYAKVYADSGTQLPSLWVFLVIVLALLILIIGATSLCMHLVQRRRRNSLQRRVINGEVDLEALGVKRLTVPPDYLHKLPVFAYLGEPQHSEKTAAQASTTVDAETNLKSHSRRSSITGAPPINRASAIFSQSTCPICLDDFEPNKSKVRELPCRHIFHVDCIDPFLLNNSSLCPICKQSVLPPGYCPAKITNVMVRRERLIRRRRAQNTGDVHHSPGNFVARLPGAYDSLRGRIGGTSSGRRIFSTSARAHSRPSEIEMTASTSAVTTVPPDISTVPRAVHQGSVPELPEPPLDQSQQRALAFVGNPSPDGEEEEPSRSRWRRGLDRVFPGFR